jgi:hypothetical protein
MRNSENINSRFIRRSRTGTLLLMPDAMETRPVQAKEKIMDAIQNILAVTARSWNIRPQHCANQESFAARVA